VKVLRSTVNRNDASDALQYIGCVHWLVFPGALASLGVDGVAWTVAHYDPLSVWAFVLGLATLANVASLSFPFLLHAFLQKGYVKGLRVTPILLSMLALWVVNLVIAFEAWFGFCPACYFG